eukprot:GHVQ01027870.1.p2 GENE.GHVQ01027870.1~~GHVQ01027870.1.p2  ORF type:complete len:100 (+),score=9.36 GHVQ01027870.1:837-1136(+)
MSLGRMLAGSDSPHSETFKNFQECGLLLHSFPELHYYTEARHRQPTAAASCVPASMEFSRNTVITMMAITDLSRVCNGYVEESFTCLDHRKTYLCDAED